MSSRLLGHNGHDAPASLAHRLALSSMYVTLSGAISSFNAQGNYNDIQGNHTVGVEEEPSAGTQSRASVHVAMHGWSCKNM